MARFAEGVAARGVRVARFEFPYMARRRESGRRGAPDRPPVLIQRWREVIERFGGGPRTILGGKSMGGRIASMVADEVEARGLVCLGYPFHPPGDTTRLRTSHLKTLRTPALIVQGTRDAFGSPAEIGSYGLSPSIRVAFIEEGDHSFKPAARSGRSEAGNLEEAMAAVRDFLLGL
jgi:predicted alpha/beta-hydrolase family hydrolase